MRPKIETKADMINYFIKKYKYKSYLEIGYLAGETFGAIKCKHKDSVDINPDGGARYRMSSDSFFRRCTRKYDIILIDANHDFHYVGRDIRNSLKHWAK
ncbi:MAG: class I SAM-dependent methyltransferase, partial [Gammaproteobacteria bacterium]|nr:class I SAM-dependent methyltransferase [Gammaproteobacteria bacterium]